MTATAQDFTPISAEEAESFLAHARKDFTSEENDLGYVPVQPCDLERMSLTILALLAAARQGEEDTTLTAVRAWFDAWADWPTAMTRDEAARLPEWDAMIDALGYDRDERRSAARAASQPQEVSR